jgi:hypothetical protein
MLNIFGRLMLLTVILGMSACAVMQPQTDEEQVLVLAEKRQAALLKYDFNQAYKYMSPGYRQLNTIEQFTSNYAGVYSWVSSNVLNASCEEDVCKVNVKVFVDMGLMRNTGAAGAEKFLIPRVNRETWFKINNKWWFSKSE